MRRQSGHGEGEGERGELWPGRRPSHRTRAGTLYIDTVCLSVCLPVSVYCVAYGIKYCTVLGSYAAMCCAALIQ